MAPRQSVDDPDHRRHLRPRTGVALLGSDAGLEEAALSIHLPTLILLFALMVVSAQIRLGGFYGWVTRRVAAMPLAPIGLLGALIFAVAGLSAVFSHDVVCLAVAPVPFLLALACASNIGSAATLIGNPQNMLIGETLHLSFAAYRLASMLGPTPFPSFSGVGVTSLTPALVATVGAASFPT